MANDKDVVLATVDLADGMKMVATFGGLGVVFRLAHPPRGEHKVTSQMISDDVVTALMLMRADAARGEALPR
jgi:hypothetical protein